MVRLAPLRKDGSSCASLDDPLLTTKLCVPLVRSGLVERRRLTERLDDGTKRKLTLVSAHAGTGKTTLLGEWSLQAWLPVTWVSLDEGDNDPVRLLAYIVAALGNLRPGIGENVLEPLRSPHSPPIQSVLTALVNEISTFPEDFALVLDDYHLIETESVHDIVAFLLDHLPPTAHLVIASRTDPPLPLPRLLARGELTKLSDSDLRFTSREAAGFLNEAMSLGLSARDITTLEERTEGWIAGLQLAALGVQGREDVAGFIAAFAGSHRYVLDYLAEEVLRKQPPGIQVFLLKTAVLNRLSGPLCDAVTGRDDGQVMLEELERANLFIVPLDEERRWFRYHHLFSEFLHRSLRQRQPGLAPELHRAACDWFEREGLAAEAIRHALSAGDGARAASLVERSARTALRRGELSKLRRWLEALSEDLIRDRPRLCLFYAWYFLATGQLDAIEPYLERAERARVENPRDIRAEATTVRAAVAGLRGEPSRAVELARQATGLLTEETLFLRSVIAGSLGFAYRDRGDVAAAGWAFAEAAELAQPNGATYVALLALRNLAEIKMVQGHLRAAEEVCRRALDVAAQREARLPASCTAHVRMGELLREWNDLGAATRHLREGIELGERAGDVEAMLEGYVTLARIEQTMGDETGSAGTLEKAKRLARRYGIDAWRCLVEAWQVRLWIARKHPSVLSSRWLEECGLSSDDDLTYPREFEHITLARVLMTRGELDEASELLSRLLGAAEGGGRGGRVVEILALQALVENARDDLPRALIPLQKALVRAEPEGYVRTFADEGAPMATLLQQLIEGRNDRPPEMKVSPQYISKLLAALV